MNRATISGKQILLSIVRDLTERTRAFFGRENAELSAFRRELEGPSATEIQRAYIQALLVDREALVAEDAQDDERQHDHRGHHRQPP